MHPINLPRTQASALGLIAPGLLILSQGVSAQEMAPAENSPARGYLEAHRDTQNPLHLLGGPLSVTLAQEDGAVYVALPAARELDEVVFGTPDMPLAFGGFPMIEGLPLEMRETEGGAFTETTQMTPFGDKHVALPGGTLKLTALDATATDAAVSEDRVDRTATWLDEKGNTYSITCCTELETVGGQHPTFGGVVTNHILHGFSRIGTPLFPTLFSYVGFWGAGEVMKNGEVLDGPRPMHGMMTEYARNADYGLVFDDEVDPTARYFHILVPPVKPTGEGGSLEMAPVKTGFTLPNGEELPFWHVMFVNFETTAERGTP